MVIGFATSQRRNVVAVNKSECLFMKLKGGSSSASFGLVFGAFGAALVSATLSVSLGQVGEQIADFVLNASRKCVKCRT